MLAPIRTMIVAVAMDDRDASTLAHARTFAETFAAEAVYLVHVVKRPAREGAAQAAVGPAEDAAIREKLQTLADGLSLPASTRIELVVGHGDVTATLAKLAGRASADLICVGRSVDSRADESTRGAVRVMRKSPCSVLVAPAGSAAEYRRVLVAVDFSPRSGEAVELAAKLATQGATIATLHAYAPPLGYHKLGQSYEEAAEAVRQEAESEQREWLAKLDLGGVASERRFVVGEEVPRKIADEAETFDADLIVVASHGRTQPAALLLGHVADATCRKTARPMLCVKRKGEVVNLIQAIAQLYEWD